MKVVILIVLYKTPILESKSVLSFIGQKYSDMTSQLVIWDNSPNPANSSDLEKSRTHLGMFDYISTPENTWLSKVYNTIVATYEFDFILLLDQDSLFPEDYLQTLCKKSNEFPKIKLFLPLVKNDGRLVSPGSFQFFKGKHWRESVTGVMSSRKVVAITSGMFISSEFFENYQYKFDERLSLYAIDTKFMLDFQKFNEDLCVIEQIINHNSALWSPSSAQQMLPRFINLRKSYAIMLSDNPLACFLTQLHTAYLSIKYAIKYRDLRFITWKK